MPQKTWEAWASLLLKVGAKHMSELVAVVVAVAVYMIALAASALGLVAVPLERRQYPPVVVDDLSPNCMVCVWWLRCSSIDKC